MHQHLLIGMICFNSIATLFAIGIGLKVLIEQEAFKKSTHTIEFRNPDIDYDDELSVDDINIQLKGKDVLKDKLKINKKSTVEMTNISDDIDSLNKKIKEEEDEFDVPIII